MNPILLALQIAVTNNVAQIRFQTPAAGSYSLQRSDDMHSWTVIASGPVPGAAHVGAHEAALPCAFYRVEWRPRHP